MSEQNDEQHLVRLFSDLTNNSPHGSSPLSKDAGTNNKQNSDDNVDASSHAWSTALPPTIKINDNDNNKSEAAKDDAASDEENSAWFDFNKRQLTATSSTGKSKRHLDSSTSFALGSENNSSVHVRHSSVNSSLDEVRENLFQGASPVPPSNSVIQRSIAPVDIVSIFHELGVTMEPLAGSLYGDYLASKKAGSNNNTTGYHSNENEDSGVSPLPYHRPKSVLNPAAVEFRPMNNFFSAFDNGNDDFLLEPPLSPRLTSAATGGRRFGGNRYQLPGSVGAPRIATSYEYKFGGYGRGDDQFLEPNGIGFLSDGTIAVVDTNASQVKLFDAQRHGYPLLKFGQPGTRQGALLYPYRLAVYNDLLVMVQRSPRPMIQIFDRNGNFIRRFGNDLQSPRAVTIDQQGRIIVIESKIMKVHIYDIASGKVWGAFDLRDYLSFPTSVCVNDRHEIFISDNETHFVRVFDYNGLHLKNIGGQDLSYPISCRINQPRRELVVIDNHEHLNISTYDYNGVKKFSHFSLMKHSQCFDVAVGYSDELAIASKDYKVYVYKLGEGVH